MRHFSVVLTLFVLLPALSGAQVEGEGTLTDAPALPDAAILIDLPQPVDAQPAMNISAMPTREDGRIDHDFTATLRVMNRKLEADVELTLQSNKTKRYDTLAFTAVSCLHDAQGLRNNDMVFLRIADEGREVFNGWMSQQFPGASLLQHPHYSVVVLGCR